MRESTSLTRRALLLQGMAAAAGLTAAPASLWASLAEDVDAGARAAPNPLLDWLCDAVIPETDTPGAVAAGVPAFVGLAVAHGLRDAGEDTVAAFGAALDTLAGGNFLALPVPGRLELLADVDRRTMTRQPDATLPPGLQRWPALKALIVIGYYTSEAGSTEELRYQLAPGRLDPDVPLEPGERAWSNDWTAVKYG
jgi:hypothetical protein